MQINFIFHIVLLYALQSVDLTTMSSVKNRIKLCWQAVKDLFVDYADHSTIHGVGYIAEKGRSWFEKIWWIIVFCISVVCCGKLIFDAWNIDPIIISFAEKPTPIWRIPFPAITICPITFARNDHINIFKLHEEYEAGRNHFKTLTEKE
jgi:acid-sensing ion channel, other